MEQWYPVQTKPRQERTAAANLARQQFTTYLPTIKSARRRGGRWFESVEPLFPGYLFVRLDPDASNTAPIRSTRGVVRMVSFGNRLRPVPGNVMQALFYAQPEDSSPIDPAMVLKAGDTVRFVEGPLAGVTAVFQARSGSERVALLLDMLGRPTSVHAAIDNIVPTF